MEAINVTENVFVIFIAYYAMQQEQQALDTVQLDFDKA